VPDVQDLHRLTWVFAVASAVSIAAWVLACWKVFSRTRSHPPQPVRAGLAPGSGAPPAIAALLTHDWDTLQVAPIATLADLAARRYVTLDRNRDGQTTVRSGPVEPSDELADYERMVLDLVTEQAPDVAIPCADLHLGYDSQATRWESDFARATRHDARARGLSRARFSAGSRTLVLLTGLVAGGLVGLFAAASSLPATATAPEVRPGPDVVLNFVLIVSPCVVLMAVACLALVGRDNDERDTPEGLLEAGRWLGLRQNLAEDPIFCAQPATAVAVWGRNLAYGIALGVAHDATHDLAFGPRPSREVWTSDASGWHVRRIRYPWAFPPGYGRSVRRNATIALVQLLVAAGLLTGVVPALLRRARALPGRHAGFDTGQASRLSLTVAAVALGLVGLWLAARGLTRLVLLLLDRSDRSVVEGRVLRYYTSGFVSARGTPLDSNLPRNPGLLRLGMPSVGWYAAVDVGSVDVIRAWYVPGTPPVGMGEGCLVRASLTRHLGLVRDLQILEPAPPGTPAVDAGESVGGAAQDAQ
jgi:hypothetical protein